MKLRIAVLAALLGSAGLPLAAQAAPPPTMAMDHSTVRDAGAEYLSTSGGVQTRVDVFAGDVLEDTGGFRVESGEPLDIQHHTGPSVGVQIQQWDSNGNLVLDGFGPPCCDPFAVEGMTIAKDLTSASLETTIPVYDSISNSTKSYAVDLAWTAIPPLTRGHFAPTDSHCIRFNDGQVENLIFNDIGRGYGASVVGSVSDGTNVYAPDTLLNAFIGEDVATFLHVGFTDGPCLA